MVSAWAALLETVENSRSVKNIVRSEDDDDWNFLRRMLDEGGVDLHRASFLPYVKTRNEHFAAYRHVDIALDTHFTAVQPVVMPYGWVSLVARSAKHFAAAKRENT